MYPYTHNISKVPIGGGAVTLLLPAGGGSPGGEGYIVGFAADAPNVYWMVYNDSVGNHPAMLRSVANSGGTANTLSTGPSKDEGWAGLQVDANSIYFADSTAKAVMKVAKAGGTPATLSSGLTYPGSLALDATSIYVMDGMTAPFSILKIAKTGGSPVSVASSLSNSEIMVIDGTNIYFTAGGSGGKILELQ